MCHQTIEKILKAYWTKNLTEIPLKIHSLSRLAEKTGLSEQFTEEQLDFIDRPESLSDFRFLRLICDLVLKNRP